MEQKLISIDNTEQILYDKKWSQSLSKKLTMICDTISKWFNFWEPKQTQLTGIVLEKVFAQLLDPTASHKTFFRTYFDEWFFKKGGRDGWVRWNFGGMKF